MDANPERQFFQHVVEVRVVGEVFDGLPVLLVGLAGARVPGGVGGQPVELHSDDLIGEEVHVRGVVEFQIGRAPVRVAHQSSPAFIIRWRIRSIDGAPASASAALTARRRLLGVTVAYSQSQMSSAPMAVRMPRG